MWPDLVQKSKDGGLDVIETYVFWNLHEPVRNQASLFSSFLCNFFFFFLVYSLDIKLYEDFLKKSKS